MDLNEEFRNLVFKYGITSVIEYAENFVKQSYEEINKIHARLFVKVHVEAQKVVKEEVVKATPVKVEEPAKEVVNVDKPVEEVAEEEVEVEAEAQAEVEQAVKKPKKYAKKVKPVEKVEEKPEEVAEESTIENGNEGDDESVKEVDPKKEKEEEKKRKEEEKREQNRIAKQKQTEAQRITFQKNKAAGINPYDMLTKDNLEKWLIKEERTYAEIAKNIVGCSEKDVSLAAKRFEVKSLYMGENGMIKAGRKKRKVKAE